MTPETRQLLVNQYRILALLDRENAKSHEINADILEDGHVSLYNTVLSGLSNSSSAEEGEEVHQILTMFRVIDNSLARLGPEEQQHLGSQHLKFEGFDANERGGHYSFAHFIMDRMGLYQEHNPLDLNSHSGLSLPGYRAMLRTYKSFPNRSDLTAEQLQQLVDARINW
ncbi:YfbU family protein [Siccationidurans ginsengisoli]|nr:MULTISPECIES: YfbU family protein [unclassified Hymenobacter]MBO2033272.1 YfbU family protein [Hymenobacter sp. BT559]